MKILYGVQGLGNGHLTRCRLIGKALLEAGHDVDFVFSGRDPDKYFSMEIFGDYKSFKGLTFYYEKGEIKIIKSVLKSNALKHYLVEIPSYDVSQYDLVLSDFEPVSAHAARRCKRPSISISRQSMFQFYKDGGPLSWKDKLIMSNYAPVDKHIGIFWDHLNENIVPPVIEKVQANLPIEEKGHILVYLPFEETAQIENDLKKIDQYQFKIFHQNYKHEKINKIEKFPLDLSVFKKELYSSTGVISNAGFTLASECMQLGKRMLLKPLYGQFEQINNLNTLLKMKRASQFKTLNTSLINEWLQSKVSDKIVYPDVAGFIAENIEELVKDSIQPLINDIWSQVKLPNYRTCKI